MNFYLSGDQIGGARFCPPPNIWLPVPPPCYKSRVFLAYCVLKAHFSEFLFSNKLYEPWIEINCSMILIVLFYLFIAQFQKPFSMVSLTQFKYKHSSNAELLCNHIQRLRKYWRDIYFWVFTRPGHFFLNFFVTFPVITNWLTRYRMKNLNIIFHMIPHSHKSI